MLSTIERCDLYWHYISLVNNNKSPHHRNLRQHPPTSNNYMCHCQSTNTEINATRSPSEISRHLSQETTTNNTASQEVSHFTIVNPTSTMDTCLITLHTNLQVITSQGSKSLHVKVAVPSLSIPLPQNLPQVLHQIRSLKKTALKPTWMTWSALNGMHQNFLGYIVLDIQHKTLPQVLPYKFYV